MPSHLICHRIHNTPSPNRGIIHPCPVIIVLQAVVFYQLLAVVEILINSYLLSKT